MTTRLIGRLTRSSPVHPHLASVAPITAPRRMNRADILEYDPSAVDKTAPVLVCYGCVNAANTTRGREHMQAKDQSNNVLTTRQVSDLIEELVGKRPTADQIREWCRQGYVAPEELPPIHLEHVRNRMGHYEITEESVRRFVEMRRRRETNLLAFVKWCRQRSAELQSKGNAESAASPRDPIKNNDDEPAQEPTDDSIAAETTTVDDMGEPDAPRDPASQSPTPAMGAESPRPPDGDPVTVSQPIIAQPTTQSRPTGAAPPIMAKAADAFAEDLLDQLVVEETGEDVEDDFFNTFAEDDQCDADSDETSLIDDDTDDMDRAPTGYGAANAIIDDAGVSPETDLPEPDLPQPQRVTAKSSKSECFDDEQPAELFDAFGSLDEQPVDHLHRKRRHGFRSRRAGRSHASPQHSQSSNEKPAIRETHDPVRTDPIEVDSFSAGIFGTVEKVHRPQGSVKVLADANNTDSVALTNDIAEVDTRDSVALIAEAPPAVGQTPAPESIKNDEPINQPEPVAEPTAVESVTTPTQLIAPTLLLPPIKPLPPNSPLLPSFGRARVSSPLRPDAQAPKKSIAKSTQNQTATAQPPRRSKTPTSQARHSAQLDQLAAAYAAFASGAAPAVADLDVPTDTREADESPAKSSPRTESPRRNIAQELQSLQSPTGDYANAPKAAPLTSRAAETPSPRPAIELQPRAPRTQNSDHPRAAAQVSRYLWLWVAAIAIGWACFGVSFMIKDDFGVIALSSIAVAATGMSGLWWTGK